PTLFYLIPGMKYFRHVSLIAPFVKLFVIFLAGVGFDRAMRRPSPAVPALGGLLLAVGGILGLLACLGKDLRLPAFAVLQSGMDPVYSSPDFHSASFIARSLGLSAAGAAGSGLLLLL